MGMERYKGPFLWACVIQVMLCCVVAIAVVWWPVEATHSEVDTVITLHMENYEPSQAVPTVAAKPLEPLAPGMSQSLSATVQNPSSGSHTPNPSTSSGTAAGETSHIDAFGGTGTGGAIVGDGGSGGGQDGGGSDSWGGTPEGTGEGAPSSGGGGSWDASGYYASIEANKSMPAAAVRRNLSGTAVFSVTFNGDGSYAYSELIGSTGEDILDSAARRLVASSGGIDNTTGEPVTITVHVRYALE